MVCVSDVLTLLRRGSYVSVRESPGTLTSSVAIRNSAFDWSADSSKFDPSRLLNKSENSNNNKKYNEIINILRDVNVLKIHFISITGYLSDNLVRKIEREWACTVYSNIVLS